MTVNYSDNPTFGYEGSLDDIYDIRSGTISERPATDVTSFFCPFCYFQSPRRYNALSYSSADTKLPECQAHGLILVNNDHVQELISRVGKDIRSQL